MFSEKCYNSVGDVMKKDPDLMKHREKNFKVISKKYEIGSVDLHWHDFLEIEIAISGEGKHILNNVEYEWKPGHIYLVRTTDFHQIELKKRGYVHLIQFMPYNIPAEILDMISGKQGNIAANLSKKDFAYVNCFCLMLQENCSDPNNYDEDLAIRVLYLIVKIIAKSMAASNEEVHTSIDESISGIVKYINEHFNERMNLDEIAQKSYFSKNHLCFYFKKKMGKTILTYIKDIRLDYALKLAVATNMKSIEICFACGYGSVSNFLKDFRNRFGASPMEMRKRFVYRSNDVKITNNGESKHEK